jgi:hypothetical protein
MTKNDPKEAYIKHRDAVEALHHIPFEKKPKTLEEAVVVKESLDLHRAEMKKLEVRLTRDQKIDLGIHHSQRSEQHGR